MQYKLNSTLTILAGMLVSSICSAGENVLPLIDGPAYTQPQNMVAVDGGRRLNLYCAGEGSPTVVLEAGQGWPIAAWGYVQPVVAKRLRTCSYDRAGIGFSDGSNRPSTSADVVDDLHHLLGAAGIKPPYVMVGHSLGGLFVRLYADTYPQDVVGLVLVDPAVENQTETFRKIDLQHRSVAQWRVDTIEPDIANARNCVAAAEGDLVPGSDAFKRCVTESFPHPQLSNAVDTAMQNNEATLKGRQADFSETENQFDASADQVRASRHSYGDLPLIVLTRGKWGQPKANATPEELVHRGAVIQAWNGVHDDIAKLSTRGVNEVVPGAGHAIQFDQPQAVIDAINSVVTQAAKDEVASKK